MPQSYSLLREPWSWRWRVLVTLALYAVYLPQSGYGPGQFRFDAAEYWELSLKFTPAGGFSLLAFDEPLRGYLGPLLVLPALYAGLMGWLRGGIDASLNEELGMKNEELESSAKSSFFIPNSSLSEALTFSILIAARNEAENLPQLLRDLAAQTLPAAQFEVLIADDHSTDGTAAIVAAAAEEVGFALRLIALPADATGKKAALLAAQQAARAPWLVCTDADCRLGP
ncbi:glycosyltransferase, partial [Hymenobacter agri]